MSTAPQTGGGVSAAAPSDPTGAAISRRAWIALYLTSAAQAMVILQSSVLNVAFPSIERSFESTPRSTLAWIVTGYAIGSAAFLLLAGRLADIYGRRRIFFLGLAVFAAASMASGFAPSPAWLIGARIVQSFGGALMVPTSLSLVLPLFPESRRSVAVGVWAAIAAIAGAGGPPLGAAVIELADWRWVFFVNAPAGLVIIAIGRRLLTESVGTRSDFRLDVVSIPIGSAAVALVTLGMLQGSRWGWVDGRTLACLAAAPVLGWIVVRRSSRHPEPLLDLSLFRDRRFAVASAVLLVFNTSVSGFWFAAPIYMQTVWDWSPLQAGLAVTPSPVMILVMSRFAGQIADRGHLVGGILGGIGATTVSMLGVVLLLEPEPNYWIGYFPWAVLYGIGLAFSWSMLTSASLVGVDETRFGAANGAGLTARSIGGAFGVALVIAVIGTAGDADHEAFRTVWASLGVIFVASALAFWRLYPPLAKR